MAENININPRTEELKTEFSNMIWKMATNLVHGGKVNPVQFMDYTLGGLFYRFISENITDYCNQLMRDAGVENADYAHMSDEMAENAREQIINAKGFFILPSQLFINVANAAKNNTELNTTLSNNFRAIENSAVGKPSENDVKGLFNNFNTNDQGLGCYRCRAQRVAYYALGEHPRPQLRQVYRERHRRVRSLLRAPHQDVRPQFGHQGWRVLYPWRCKLSLSDDSCGRTQECQQGV